MTIATVTCGHGTRGARIGQEEQLSPRNLPVRAPSLDAMSGEAGRTANEVGADRADSEGRRGNKLETFVARRRVNVGEPGNRGRRGRSRQRERTRRVVLRMRGRCLIGPAAMMHALMMLMAGLRLLLALRMTEHPFEGLHDTRRAEHELQPPRVHRQHEAGRDQRPRDQQRENPKAQQLEVMTAHGELEYTLEAPPPGITKVGKARLFLDRLSRPPQFAGSTSR